MMNVSDYYVAEEIASVYNGMDLILEPQDWKAFVTGSISEVSTFLLIPRQQHSA